MRKDIIYGKILKQSETRSQELKKPSNSITFGAKVVLQVAYQRSWSKIQKNQEKILNN
jgi:hypothetical protein